MLDDIIERSLEAIGKLDAIPGRQITGLSIGSVIGLEWERGQPIAGNWRARMNRILDHLAKTDTGLLVTVDEVLPDFNELRQLVATYQHFTRERRKVALLLAGLPHNISSLLRDKTVSFLRRAKRQRIGRVPDASVASASTTR
ncbi:MAG: hypothetical protein IKG21_01605 [Atopobiaceae bacterium]|nr:hypothetical protein [Atopobiaceae bacterium]